MNCNTIYCSNVTMGDTDVVLIPNRAIKTLTNCGSYRLVICSNATATANLPVFIQVNGVNIPILCKAGNTMYANQLQKRVNYGIMYGNDNENYTNGQFVVQDRVCPKSTTIPATTTNSEEVNPNNYLDYVDQVKNKAYLCVEKFLLKMKYDEIINFFLC